MLYAPSRRRIDTGALDAQIAELEREIATLERMQRELAAVENSVRSILSPADAIACIESPNFEDCRASLAEAIRDKNDELNRLDAVLHGEPVF